MRSRRRILVGAGLVVVLLAGAVLASEDARLYLEQLANRAAEQAPGTPAGQLSSAIGPLLQ